MDVGTDVWVKCPRQVWTAGVVLDCQDVATTGVVTIQLNDSGAIVTRIYREDDDQENELCIRNKTRNLVQMDCLTNLEYLHEPALLQALSDRFAHDRVYTSIGDILVAVNPFKDVDFYSQKHIDQYKQAMYADGTTGGDGVKNLADCPPHIFAIAGKAYGGLLKNEQRNQSILVSGESGSGKTESTKFLMHFLTSVGRDQSIAHGHSSGGNVVEIGKRILQTNPILESFGNAQTIRNDNSSRFGKFIKIQFGHKNQIVGAKIASYLLEKVRLLHQSPEERNFHIFYELLEGAGAELLASFGLKQGGSYELLNAYGPSFTRRGKFGAQYARRFKETIQAFEDTGVKEEERLEILKILAALLHLGNVNFAMDARSGITRQESAVVTSTSRVHLEKCADLMGIEVTELEALLLTRAITAGAEVMVLKLNPEQSKDICRALAKSIYGRLFTWLVRRLSDGINYCDSVASDSEDEIKTIGILDIFGFESLSRNGFEQLCINYANERLQAQFNEFVFIKEQDVYMSEDIDWRSIPYPSNDACLALFDDKADGLFSLLDQECLIPKGSDQALCTKFYRYHGGDGDAGGNQSTQSSQRYTLPTLMKTLSLNRYLQPSNTIEEETREDTKRNPFSASKMDKVKQQFVVSHFAGKVCYRVEQFIEKNLDMLPTDAGAVLCASSNTVVTAIGDVEIVDQYPENGSTRRRYSLLRAPSVSAQFKNQLDRLIDEIGQTEAHYVRCLKPNELKKPEIFDRERMVEQLRSVGVLEALRIARAGYSVRLKHATFATMFGGFRYLLRSKNTPTSMTSHSLSLYLVAALLDEVAKGSKKDVITRHEFVSLLSTGSIEVVKEEARRKGVQVGKTLVFCKTATFNQFSRLRLELRERSVVILQKEYRGYCQRKRFQLLRDFAGRVQSIVRGFIARKNVQRMKQARRDMAARTIQICCRRWLLHVRQQNEQVRIFRLKFLFNQFKRSSALQKEIAAKNALLGNQTLEFHTKPVVVDEDASTDVQSCASLDANSDSDETSKHVHGMAQDSLQDLIVNPLNGLDSKTQQRKAKRESEIVRLRRMLVEKNSSEDNFSPKPLHGLKHIAENKRDGRPPRYFSRNRSVSTGGIDLIDEDEEDDEVSLLPPRRAQSAFQSYQQDQVAILSRKIEELDAKCKFLERVVARTSVDGRGAYPYPYGDLPPGGRWDKRENASSDGGSVYGDGGSSERDLPTGTDGIIRSIQQQMEMLRQSIAIKEEALHGRRDVHGMSFSSNRPTRSSSAASSISNPGMHGESSTDNQLSPRSSGPYSGNSMIYGPYSVGSSHHGPYAGGSVYNASYTGGSVYSGSYAGSSVYGGHGPYPVTPSGSYYHPSPHSGRPRLGSRGMPRIVKWARDNECYECKEPFNIFVRRHHCRMCGNSFCHEHSSRRVSVFGIGFDDEPVRVCDSCFTEHYNVTHQQQLEPYASPYPTTRPYSYSYGSASSSHTSAA